MAVPSSRRNAPLLVVLLIVTSLSGCITTGDGNNGTSSGTLENPTWEVGNWWLYTFITPEFGEDSARLVVAENSSADSAWILAI